MVQRLLLGVLLLACTSILPAQASEVPPKEVGPKIVNGGNELPGLVDKTAFAP